MTKNSIALVIRESPPNAVPERTDAVRQRTDAVPERRSTDRWLLVRRPDDDEDLPGLWGLPAGTRGPGESDRDLVRRIGREKLAVDVEPGAPVAAGSSVRPAYRLDMSLWTAEIVRGEPTIGGAKASSAVTRYSGWRWDEPDALREGAEQGSLCCRLGIELASRI